MVNRNSRRQDPLDKEEMFLGLEFQVENFELNPLDNGDSLHFKEEETQDILSAIRSSRFWLLAVLLAG